MRLNWGSAPISAFDIFQLFLVALCLGVAFTRPASCHGWFSRIEQKLFALSRRPWLCALVLFALPISLRLLLLPVYGVPTPLISDEYAYLLQSDTFSQGRLTNPTPPFPDRFASVYVLTEPSYTAEYQPAQGFVLAAGQAQTGVPWSGVVMSMGVLCVVVYWALLAWLPAQWAFTGALLTVAVELGVLSYWMNSYWGGCVPAIGGAFVMGGLIRLRDRKRAWFSLVTAAGLVILVNSRPLEGVFLGLLVLGALLYWALVSKQISVGALLGQIAPVLVLSGVLAAAFAGYFNTRVTGNAFEFPYLLYRSEYGLPQGFFWQKPVIVSTAMPADIRAEYENQLRQHERRKSLKALLGATAGKLRRFWEFYIGIPLTASLLFLRSVWHRPNMRLVLCGLVLVLGIDNLLFFAYFPHYSAAVTVLIVLVMIQCLRQMRKSGRAGLFLARALPAVCVASLLIPIGGRLLEPALPSPLSGIRRFWASEFAHDTAREHFVPALEQQGGRQLVFVRYQPFESRSKFEWIYNRADIENAKIIWIRDSRDAKEDLRVINRFTGRKIWLAEPDADPPRITPYSPGNNGASE